MKKILSFLGIIAASVGLLALLAAPAQADQANTTISSGQTYRGFFIRAAEKVQVDGTVEGDVWAAGTEVVINGTVDGSVYVAGQNVTINGTVTGNVQAAGSRVVVNGKVKGALYGAGSEVSISKEAIVQNGAILTGSVVELNGSVGNQTIIAGSIIRVNGSVDGNLTLRGSQADLGSDAKVNGNLKYNQTMKITIANDKGITGAVVKTQDTQQAPSLTDRLRDILLGLVVSLITGLVLILVLPLSSRGIATEMTKHPFRSFFVGIAFVIFVPVVAILLLISFFGIQLAVLLGLGYAAVLLVGELFVALCIGNAITRPKAVNLPALATSFILGLIILTALKLIPYLGGIVGIVVFLVGAGAIASYVGKRIKTMRENQVGVKAPKA